MIPGCSLGDLRAGRLSPVPGGKGERRRLDPPSQNTGEDGRDRRHFGIRPHNVHDNCEHGLDPSSNQELLVRVVLGTGREGGQRRPGKLRRHDTRAPSQRLPLLDEQAQGTLITGTADQDQFSVMTHFLREEQTPRNDSNIRGCVKTVHTKYE